MFHVELAPLGGILGPLKSDLGVFGLHFGSFFAWFYNVKTQKNVFSQKAPNRIGWFLVYALLLMSSITVPNPANRCFLSRSSRSREGCAPSDPRNSKFQSGQLVSKLPLCESCGQNLEDGPIPSRGVGGVSSMSKGVGVNFHRGSNYLDQQAL